MVDNQKIALYITADQNYIFQAVVTILSFKRFFPSIDYYILTNKNYISIKIIQKIQQYKINIIHTDSFEKYENNQSWPKICYALFSGPRIFYNLGYKYSIGVDADILCLKSFDLEEIINNTNSFSGIVNKADILGNFLNPDLFLSQYNLCNEQVNALVNPNTGIIFWNNEWAESEFHLEETAFKVYEKNYSNIIAVDQSLLAAIIIINQLIYYHIDHRLNFRIGNQEDWNLPIKQNSIKIVHYTVPKPWKTVFNRATIKPNSIRIIFFKINLILKWRIFIHKNHLKMSDFQ